MLHNYYLMPLIFLLGIILISLEDKVKVNKGATAIFMAITLWLLLTLGSNYILIGKENEEFARYLSENTSIAHLTLAEQIRHYISVDRFVFHLGSVAETLFFVMGSMLIVNIVDVHGGFRSITDHIYTSDKRRLLWYFSLLAFFLSALLDNIAAALVLIAILRKVVPEQTDRLKYACMIIISANAGGAWSPIGDVTTLLLWTGGNLTATHQISHVFLPALTNLLVPTLIAHLWLFKKGATLRAAQEVPNDPALLCISERERKVILGLGVLSLGMVPIFQTFTGLPPFLCVLLGLSLLWIYTDLMHGRSRSKVEEKLRVTRLFKSLDLATIFFFLGVLMSVAALETAGLLRAASTHVDKTLHSPFLFATLLGIFSSFTDNVALVAGTIGMYPLPHEVEGLSQYALNFIQDGTFWTSVAYTAVTGGSLLIIGSATGVTVMGLEKIPFRYYLQRFSILALSGYLSGLGVLRLIQGL